MILARRPVFVLAAAALAFAAALTAFNALDRAPGIPRPAAVEVNVPRGASTADRIRALQRSVRRAPTAASLSALGAAYLQRVRETGDPTFYPRAETVLRRALARNPRSVDARTALGMLELARHDFAGGLREGLAARRAAPDSVAPYPVIVDALVELGRYDEAERTLQRLVDLKPTLAAYARVSYLRELHGDLAGAAEAMRLAVSAGAAAPENSAYVQTLLANLELMRGRTARAARGYRSALVAFPSYVPAQAGLARVDATRGRLASAIPRYRAVVARLPLPEYVVALGEAELAAGAAAGARRDLALVRAEQRLLAGSGVNTDVELALFEADHGAPARAVALARRAWAQAPSVRSADALGWALTRASRPREGLAWARRALRLGSADPSFLHHAGFAALGAGERGRARAWLSASLARNPRWSPYLAPKARRALEELR